MPGQRLGMSLAHRREQQLRTVVHRRSRREERLEDLEQKELEILRQAIDTDDTIKKYGALNALEALRYDKAFGLGHRVGWQPHIRGITYVRFIKADRFRVGSSQGRTLVDGVLTRLQHRDSVQPLAVVRLIPGGSSREKLLHADLNEFRDVNDIDVFYATEEALDMVFSYPRHRLENSVMHRYYIEAAIRGHQKLTRGSNFQRYS
jgi:hypothetical protein